MRAIVNSKYILEDISNVNYTNNNIIIQFRTENATKIAIEKLPSDLKISAGVTIIGIENITTISLFND